ncbi:glycine cleavage protein H-like protein [Chlamydia muridarum str. Nigg]|jgi:glycine cleavage protein H-like protein, Chlamydial|uniref:Glycine cleavage system H-like protein n=2 Tax=Chlamydia muridarum TaxID=83560 RepID=GCSHL_CHLMU|nr:glycine cleavage protein H-like protein [Chlamydia muridarum]Q9PKB2.1 RecName: Full=Glycine cleavage system H-like protein [Chlamydia muridarum str. Nigg]UFW37696.1 glycine cleavage protein H-like protein [Chlamydia trachomatis]AAF39393.1 glycine cleavage system H protein [Chlamydia muridarum str. Nigg]AHH22943.1 glycine cleavage system protein H [Chlamydia muridarum str. Nigg3 CMUT3-5]AHH23868.1 glycine cleavage system protein H [Chlamydia muridarum str. Nigg CM972]AID38076.1 glycine clea
MKGKKYYSDYHVWIEPIHSQIVRLGLSSRMQEHLGNILHIDLPSLGASIKEGEELCVLESSKSAIEVLSPVSGEVIEVNIALEDDTHPINHSAESEGWFVVLQLSEDFDGERFSLDP